MLLIVDALQSMDFIFFGKKDFMDNEMRYMEKSKIAEIFDKEESHVKLGEKWKD